MSQFQNHNAEILLEQSSSVNNKFSAEPKFQRSLSMKGSFTFTIGRDSNEVKTNEPQVMEQGLEDELLLTQLALDDREIVIYDIASAIYLGERQRNAPLHTFKCFFDKESANFFVELSDKSPFEHLTKSTFLRILDIAESLSAERVHVCLHNKTSDIGAKIQTLLFVGFKKLIGESLKSISKTRTHTLLCYNLNE